MVLAFTRPKWLLATVLLLLPSGSHGRPAEPNNETEAATIEEQDTTTIKTDLTAENVHILGLRAVASTTKESISLAWATNPASAASEVVEGYRIYYKHDTFKDVKTIKNQSPEYELSGLEPYTEYEIWVAAIVEGVASEPSQHIKANTDVDEPSPPVVTNVTCYDTGMLYVEWNRPAKYDRSVDYYKIFYRATTDRVFESIPIQADAKEEKQRFVIDKLAGNHEYVVKICAGTKSVSNPNKTWLGEPSGEVRVYLPEYKCQTDSLLIRGELSAGMIVGAVCAVLFLCLAVIGFVIWRQYFKAAYYYLDEPNRVIPPVSSVPNWEDDPGPDGGELSGAIKVSDFSEHVALLHADSDAGFNKEYEEIQNYSAKCVKASHDNSSHPDNKCKNRYLNIVAYDHSRVKLLPVPGQKKTSDYINANYIDGFQKANAYIGTQGPLDDTVEAFWRMVWEQNVYVIVMITNLMERGRRKCDRYWPKAPEETETYGHVEATLEKEQHMANFTVRTIKIKHLKLKRKKGVASEREVKQFHYTSWPDHGVPCHPLPVLTFIRKSAGANPIDGGPIIVHCSAGVGRTGTYIAVDAMQKQAVVKREFNVYGFLRHIRGQRNYLVQTEEQYVFIHDALLEATRSGVITEIAKHKLAEYIDKLLRPHVLIEQAKDDVEEGKQQPLRLIDQQFKLATSLEPSEYQYTSARMECNLAKNRDSRLIPLETSKIPLAPKPGVEGSDYINASWLHGHDKLKEFIITQHPTLEVKEDFWRMLWDHNAQTVVLLSALDDKEFPTFWPLIDEDYELETFRVRFVEEAVHEGHSTFDFVVSSQHDDYELAVRVIHCPDWSSNVTNRFAVLKLVQDWHLEYQDGPLVVVDKNGGTEAATFCALTTLCKQLDTYDSIDVYQVAKLYHNKRPGIWRTADDMMFLYKAMESLIASHASNPVHQQPSDKCDGLLNNVAATATTSVTTEGAPVTSSSNQSSLVPPERRHSASASDWSNGNANGNATQPSEGPTTNGINGHRRHSLPNGDVIMTTTTTHQHSNGNGNAVVVKNNHHDDDEEEEEEEDEEISETVALTSAQHGKDA